MMTHNVFSAISMAACLQSSYGVTSDPRERQIQGHQPSRAIDILTMSGDPKLSVYLSELFEKSGWATARARTCKEGVSFLELNQAAVVVCEESLPDGFWHDAAAALASMPDAPALVVVGHHQSLLQEVVALGGFDVLVRPLRESEVVWTIASAWHAWKKRFESDAGSP